MASAVLSAQDLGRARDALRALVPGGLAIGESHGGFGLDGANFATWGTAAGNWTYFGAKKLRALPSISTPWGDIRQAISLVGTAGQSSTGGFTDQTGLGWAAVVPTPAGDLLVFANMRQDAATIGNLLQQDRGRHLLNINFGILYSVTDAASWVALRAKAPKAAAAFKTFSELSPVKFWAGAGYSTVGAQLVVEDGVPSALIVAGHEIPLEQLGALFGDPIESRALNGGYRPESLNRSVLRDFDPRYTNLIQETQDWLAVIQRAIDRRVVTPSRMVELLEEARTNPDAVFADLPPAGRRAALAMVHAALGDPTGTVQQILRGLYPGDNPADGIRPRALAQPSDTPPVQGRQGGRVFQDWVGNAAAGRQLAVFRDSRTGRFSAHGPGNAQYLLAARTLDDALRETQDLLGRRGWVSPHNAYPFRGVTGNVPSNAPRWIHQGYAGVPGLGQLAIQLDSINRGYRAVGPTGAQYSLEALTRQDAAAEVRAMITHGGVSAGNLYPRPQTGTLPTDQPRWIHQGYAGVPGRGQLAIQWDAITGGYRAVGPTGAQYSLEALTRQDAAAEVRAMITHGGVSADNLYRLLD